MKKFKTVSKQMQEVVCYYITTNLKMTIYEIVSIFTTILVFNLL